MTNAEHRDSAMEFLDRIDAYYAQQDQALADIQAARVEQTHTHQDILSILPQVGILTTSQEAKLVPRRFEDELPSRTRARADLRRDSQSTGPSLGLRRALGLE